MVCARTTGVAVRNSHRAAIAQGKVHVMIREPLVPEHGVRKQVGSACVVGCVEDALRERHLVDGQELALRHVR